MEDNKKKIINILCGIIVLCIVGLLASIVIKVINKNKENQIKEESTEFFDDYLYTFNSSFGKKIGYFENIDEEDYSKFAVLYYYQNLEDKSANTFTISREKIENIVFKYFNISNFDLKETDETKELFQVKKLQNTYKIDINPVDFGYDSYKISDVTYNDNEVTVKYDIYQGNTTDTKVIGEKIFYLRYNEGNYNIYDIKIKYIDESYKNESMEMVERDNKYFLEYLEPFNFCQGNKLIDKANFKDDYGTIVAMYYIKKNKGNNISSYDITQEEANKITYKYFGVKDIDISKEDDNFSIKKKNNGYTISWKSTSCGFKKYEITELYYEENIVKLKVEEFSLNENNEYELSLNKHFTLEFKDGYYRILKINSKIEGEEGYVEY